VIVKPDHGGKQDQHLQSNDGRTQTYHCLRGKRDAGWLCSKFALTEESGQVLRGGIACYDAALKVSLLKVPQGLIDQFTPESMEVTREMAYRLPALIASDIQVTVTGLTTPGG
jgi:nicotinamide-nucleotide amidase